MGGARVLGLEAQIGSLEPAKRADVIVVGTNRARQTPLYDPVSQLVYATHGDDVEDDDRERAGADAGPRVLTLDEPRVLEEARQCLGEGTRRRPAVSGAPIRG